MAQETISIVGLLKKLHQPNPYQSDKDLADEIALAISRIFDNLLETAQCASLLTLLSLGRDQDPLVLAKTAARMREAAAQVDRHALRKAVHKRGLRIGTYHGGLCDIVGTGGDGHSTFNVSTTASIVASSLLLISKHGNRASSSTSGSADLLQSILPIGPRIGAITAATLPSVYGKSNYAFLFAPQFHPGMRHVAPVRKSLGFPTIFNLLGPLANPVEGDIEARIVGVRNTSLGMGFAKALSLTGARKGMVVCGAEDLDEISCAGKTHCWRLVGKSDSRHRDHEENILDGRDHESPPADIESFELEPVDFGLSAHPLNEVAGGKMPHENAKILMTLLQHEIPDDDPILDFVLMNTAALFAVSGVCEAEGDEINTERGPGGLRWKEGVRRAKWAISSGEALKSLNRYVDATHNVNEQ